MRVSCLRLEAFNVKVLNCSEKGSTRIIQSNECSKFNASWQTAYSDNLVDGNLGALCQFL